jgi:hypothetical protein
MFQVKQTRLAITICILAAKFNERAHVKPIHLCVNILRRTSSL